MNQELDHPFNEYLRIIAESMKETYPGLLQDQAFQRFRTTLEERCRKVPFVDDPTEPVPLLTFLLKAHDTFLSNFDT